MHGLTTLQFESRSPVTAYLPVCLQGSLSSILSLYFVVTLMISPEQLTACLDHSYTLPCVPIWHGFQYEVGPNAPVERIALPLRTREVADTNLGM